MADEQLDDELRKDQRPLPPIGMAMAMPSSPRASTPAPMNPAMAMPENAPQPAAAPPAMPVGSGPAPQRPAFQLPPDKKSLTTQLWDKTGNIQNPFERILARTGVGIGKALDIAGSAIAPGIAMQIPGSQVNTQLANKRQDTQAIQTEQLNQKPELELDAAASKADIEREKEQAAQKRVDTQQQGAGERTAAREAGANERSANTIIGHENIAKMEEDNKAAAAAGKPQPHITTMVGGQSHVMERDPKTGDYSIDRGIAPPNFAMVAPSLKTIDVLENGVPTVETLGGKQLGTAATGAPGHEMFQAGVVQRAGKDLIDSINKNRDKLGDVGAIVNSAFLGTPLSDPVASGLAAQIATYAALNPAMHGVKGAQAIKMFEQIVGGIPNNPDSLIAAINAIGKTASTIAPPQHGGAGAPPAGANIISLDDFLKPKK